MGESDDPIQREKPPHGYKVQSPDTEYWAEKLLFEHWRCLTPRETAAVLTDLAASVHHLCLMGLRDQHPDLTEEELELKAAALRLGRERILAMTGRDPDRLGLHGS